MNRYSYKVNDSGNLYWGRIKTLSFPSEPYKYMQTRWVESYTWRRLAYWVYGDPDLYWLILQTNNMTNPHDVDLGDDIKILKNEYLNEL